MTSTTYPCTMPFVLPSGQQRDAILAAAASLKLLVTHENTVRFNVQVQTPADAFHLGVETARRLQPKSP